MRSILQAAGLRVHTYTSPHLVSFNERIGILGCDIEDNFLYEVLEECRLASEKLAVPVTFFEGTTAAAFLAFSKVEADVIILEVGMGGRLDATNVIKNPIMSIITSISLDHTDFLGDNVVKIAYEKAGIIKPNCPCVISQQYEEVMDLLHEISEQNNSPCYSFEYDWIIDSNTYESQDRVIKLPKLSLLGVHQYLNAGNAITAAINLQIFNITDEHIIKGLSNAVWPARLQKLNDGKIVRMLPKTWQIWVDGAHNESGAHALSVWLQTQEVMPTYMIFGMTKGRDCNNFLESFTGRIKHLMGVLIEAEPSSYNAEFIRAKGSEMGIASSAADSIEDAIEMILAI
ncbi:MAG: hypothetical protein B7Z05_08885 [Thiotrichales bacterium 32-46-8]|nr:MAG: hypothetical protein B7Z05_08885 [Thiotrichales bacterium 32-46-8]